MKYYQLVPLLIASILRHRCSTTKSQTARKVGPVDFNSTFTSETFMRTLFYDVNCKYAMPKDLSL